MSNRNNDVFQVLVTKGNLAPLAAGGNISALAVGQIGAFDANTNVSIGAATSPMPRDIYFAVGVNHAGGATLADVRQSAGQMIQRKGILNYSFRPHTAGRPMIVEVGDYLAQCDTDYGIKIEFRNSKIQRMQGTVQFTKSYIVRTGCCDACAEGCNTADPNELTILLVNAINGDDDKMVIAEATARTALTTLTHGTSVNYAIDAVMTLADVQALITYNAANPATMVYSNIKLTSVPLTAAKFCQVNLHFHRFLQTHIEVSIIDGFNCSGAVTVLQELVQEEGSSVNIKQKEYHASAWDHAGPYVVSDTTGTPMDNILYLTVDGQFYDQYILEYDQKSMSGWLEYENPLSTIFAIPEADIATRDGLGALIDAIVVGLGFEALADDAATSNVTATVVEPATGSKAIDKDGLA